MSRQIIQFQKRIPIRSFGAVAGELESRGPMKKYFDLISADSKFGMDTWEKAEAEMVRCCVDVVLKKAKLDSKDIDLVLAGDLTNQCVSSTFGLKDKPIPYLGLYGACSTFALSLGMGALSAEAGLGETILCVASSHFCSAERQYRFPLEYGCQRTPTAQTTVTGAGCILLAETEEKVPCIKEFLPGIVRDYGITDAANMGAAMAPACADTLLRYFASSEKKPNDFSLILTGDLGEEGRRILLEICRKNGLELSENHEDCGRLIFDTDHQEVNCGGSGCGCSAAVFSSYIMEKFRLGELEDILLVGTGALLSANTVLQNETIPGIAHLVRITKE